MRSGVSGKMSTNCTGREPKAGSAAPSRAMASIAPGVSLEDRRFEVRRLDRIAGLLEPEPAGPAR